MSIKLGRLQTESFAIAFATLIALFVSSAHAAVLFWDPDGATPGTSISGNWDTITPNWTATADSGVNSTWAQGSDASFGLASAYTVTLTEPIAVGNVSLSGSAGTLTIAGSSGLNTLTLGGSANFNTGARTLTLSAALGGAFDLTKSGTGTLTLSGANTYSGGTVLTGGTVGIGVDSISAGGVITSGALGTALVNVTAGSTISASGGAHVVHNPVTLNAGLTIGGTLPLTFAKGDWTVAAGNRTITVNNSADTSISANFIDDGVAHTLTKAGTGRLILSGSNSAYLGALTVSAGTLTAGSDTAIQFGGFVTATGTLDLNGFTGSVNGLAGAGSVILGAGTLIVTNTTSTSRNFTGVISGLGGVVISSSGVSQQIEGMNTFTGGMLVRQGTVFLRTNLAGGDNISRAAGTGTITIDDTGVTPRPAVGANYSSGIVRITNSIFLKTGRALLFPSNGGANQFDGVISGPAGILRDNNGSGLVILMGNNTFVGGLEIDSRALALGHKNALGIGEFVIGNPLTFPATSINLAPLVDLGGANAITNVATVNQNFTISATNNFELSGPMMLNNTPTITVVGTSPATFSGTVDGPATLTKAGTNVLILKGNNTYYGGTVINGGTLLVNNTAGSGTGTNTVTVNADATLGGNGTVAGPVTLNTGGNIGAGSGAGKLTLLNGLDLSLGGLNIWELASLKDDSTGTAGTDFDQLSLTGGNLVLGAPAALSLQFIGSAPAPSFGKLFWQTNHSWKIIALSGSAGNPGSLNFGAIAGTNGIVSGTFSTAVDGSGNIILSYVAAPPPPAPVIESNISGAGTTNATIRWSSTDGVGYEVQYKDDLYEPSWHVLGSVTASGSTASIVDSTNPPATNRFYRVVVQ